MEITKPVTELDKLSQTDDGATRKESLQELFSTSVASLSTTETITVIPITKLSKYVVTYYVDKKMSARELKELHHLLDIWRRKLRDWWNGDDKFFMILEADGTGKVKFERLE